MRFFYFWVSLALSLYLANCTCCTPGVGFVSWFKFYFEDPYWTIFKALIYMGTGQFE